MLGSENLLESALTIAQEARNSLGDFCIRECKAQCCQRGQLLLMTDNEVKAIVGSKKNDYLKCGILTPSRNGFFTYNSEIKTCKNLKKDFTCKIHLNTSRPLVCRDYPVFLVKDYVMFGKTCPAVEKGMMKPFAQRFKKIGVKVI